MEKKQNGIDPQSLALQLKRAQAAIMTLARQREDQADKAAEARIEAMLAGDENVALRQRVEALNERIASLQKEIEALKAAPINSVPELPLVDGVAAPRIN